MSEEDVEKTLKEDPIDPLAVKAGAVLVPPEAWYTDGSCKGQPLKWQATVYQPLLGAIRMEVGEGCSGQWAELRAVWLVIVH